MRALWLVPVLLLSSLSTVDAGTVHAAVAANFTKIAEQLGADFTAPTGHEMVFSFGATGALYTQATQGAPFDVFLSADDKRTATAVADGVAVAGTEFTYAVGALALYAPGLAADQSLLEAGAYQHIAIADPATAPYGAAAMAVLDGMGLTAGLADRIVTGENITQTLQFIDSGSAELGFVALSQVIDRPSAEVWRVPQALYPTIRQNAVLLKVGADNEAAVAFLAFLRSDAAKAVIVAAGYEAE